MMLLKFVITVSLLYIVLNTKAQTVIVVPKNKISFCQKTNIAQPSALKINITTRCTVPKNNTHYYCVLSKDSFHVNTITEGMRISINNKPYTGKLQFTYDLDFHDYIYEIQIVKGKVTNIAKTHNPFKQEEFPLPHLEKNSRFELFLDNVINKHFFNQVLATFYEDQLARLSASERRYLKNSLLALHGYSFSDTIWQNHFQKKHWYNKQNENNTIQYSSIDSSNLALLDCFEKATIIPPNSGGFGLESLLNGCWQTGGTTVGSGYADLFRFDFKKKTYSYQTNNEGPEEKDELTHKGTYQIKGNQLQLLVYEKEMALTVIRQPEPRGLNKIDTIRSKWLPIVLDKKKREKRLLSISAMYFITTPDDLSKVFIKIGDTVYWRIAKEVVDCSL